MSDQRAFAVPGGEPARDAADDEQAPRGLTATALALQRAAGNRVARRVLGRAAVPTVAEIEGMTAAWTAIAVAANRAALALADWMNVVPDADPRAYAITKLVAGKQVVQYGTTPKPTPKKGQPAPPPDPAPVEIDATRQQAIDTACQKIADFRATLPQPAATGRINSGQGAKWAGTWWTRYTATKALAPPKATKKNPNPVDPRTAEQKAGYESAKAYDAWLSGVSKATTSAQLGDRLFLDIAGLEGGTDSINVYDKQIVTWGGGLGGASGAVPAAMKLVADSKATGGGKVVGEEVSRVLHAAGIGFGTNKAGAVEFVVCDPASKRKYRGDSALHLIKADNRLLMLFTSISRGELPGAAPDPQLQDAMRKAVFDAQKDYFLNHYMGGDYAAAIKQLGATWPYDSIMMVLHLEWWGVSRWTQFKDTGGDMKQIVKKAFSLYTSYTQTRNGAHVAVRDLADHLQHFGGATSNACWGPPQQLATDALEDGAYYAEIVPGAAATDKTPAKDATYRKLKD